MLWNGSYPLTCDNCHLDNTLHHEDPVLFKDGRVLAETDACDGCHSPGGAFDGVNDAVFGAKANWDSGVYAGTNYENLQTGKEKWCTTCHDNAPPTINGRTAKNIAGDNSVYGYFISGHGEYDVVCTDCHDPQLVHIDDYDRTYSASSHNYTQGYRLKLVSGNTPMVIPRTGGYNSSQFRLCYSCHDENTLLNISPIFTDFADLTSISNNNLHYYHLVSISSGFYWDSDFSGETGSKDSNPSCPACHNPHGKDYDNRATISMTRQDLSLVHQRDVSGLLGHLETFDWGNAGGDVNCFGMCHQNVPPNTFFKYYYELGTHTPDDPGFWTKLGSQTDITNPTYGTGGTFLGGTFASYDRHGVTETGLSITSGTQGAQFPSSNIDTNDEYYGETIDFWYVPNFNFNGNTTTRFLFDYYDDANNFIRIRVVAIAGGYSGLDFRITNAGTAHVLATEPLYWTAGSVHHIVCTWGPAQGMHMYLDRMEPSYLTSGGLNYYGGINQTASNFYVGRRYDGSLPSSGIMDDFKIYGYQYQKFENGLALFSKMGSAGEINTPVKGNGGSVAGSVGIAAGQQGNSAQFSSSNKGVVNFPTSDLNPDQDTIDLWYRMAFNIEDNADSTKHLFWYYIDDSNNAFIRVDNDTLNFTIVEGGSTHTLKTTGLKNWDWYHVVCSWGPDGMHIYMDDKEAGYSVSDGLSYTGGLPATGMPANFQIGNKGQGLNNYCNGNIDELRVYGYQAGAQSLEFITDCPVDMSVMDPQGNIISREQNEISGARYIERDIDGDGSLDDKIIIPHRLIGNYAITVFPEPGANPADTFTLRVVSGGNMIVLAKEVPVGNLSDEHTYEVTSTTDGLKLAKLVRPEDGAVLSQRTIFDWRSIGFDGFKIEFSSDPKFEGEKLTFPRYRWPSRTRFTPTERQWQKIERMGGRSKVIYWRVIASDDKGNTGLSETRSFSLR